MSALGLPFHLTEPQELLRRTVRELAERHIAPRAAEIDEREEYPEDVFQLLKAHDLLGLYVPAEYGGSGLGNGGGVDTVPVDAHGFHHSVVATLPPLGAIFLAADDAP